MLSLKTWTNFGGLNTLTKNHFECIIASETPDLDFCFKHVILHLEATEQVL